MTDTISRSRVLDTLEAEKARLMGGKGCDWPFTGEILAKAVDTVIDFIKQLPALDVAPVVHARWIPDCETVGDDYFGYDEEWFVRCSRCGRIERDVNSYPLMDGDIRAVKQDYPYCHCGARMDGEAE